MVQHDTTDLTAMAWTVLAPLMPAASPGERPRTTAVREVVHAIV
jgi:transposase